MIKIGKKVFNMFVFRLLALLVIFKTVMIWRTFLSIKVSPKDNRMGFTRLEARELNASNPQTDQLGSIQPKFRSNCTASVALHWFPLRGLTSLEIYYRDSEENNQSSSTKILRLKIPSDNQGTYNKNVSRIAYQDNQGQMGKISHIEYKYDSDLSPDVEGLGNSIWGVDQELHLFAAEELSGALELRFLRMGYSLKETAY